MPAVNEHRELHRARPPKVADRVERRANGAARVEDVVDEHNRGVVDARFGKRRRADRARGLAVQVVSIHRDVESARAFRGAERGIDPGQGVGQS